MDNVENWNMEELLERVDTICNGILGSLKAKETARRIILHAICQSCSSYNNDSKFRLQIDRTMKAIEKGVI